MSSLTEEERVAACAKKLENYKYEKAIACKTEEEAEAYIQGVLDIWKEFYPEVSENGGRHELGAGIAYYAGYHTPKDRERVERLFNCEHHIFGGIAEYGEPTPSESLNLGALAGMDTKGKWLLKQRRKK